MGRVREGSPFSLRRSARDAEDGAQGRFAKQDLRGLRTAVRLAQEMGARLGRGEVLFGAVPGGEGLILRLPIFCSELARKIHEAVGFGVLRGSDVGSLSARRT